MKHLHPVPNTSIMSKQVPDIFNNEQMAAQRYQIDTLG